MPPANIQRLHTPRTAATVLGEIREARSDLDDAMGELAGEFGDLAAAEADQRLDDLREEFAARVQSALGLSVEDLRAAYEGALI